MIENKRILCFGGAGSIGSELVRQLATLNQIYIFDLDETRMYDLVEELGIKGRVGNIEDYNSVEETFIEFKPDIIFMTAARKHVTPSEEQPMEAVRTNILGIDNVIRVCKKYGGQLINISTDKVINQESIMGLTKKIAEKMVRNAGYVSVRFGNVLGSRGSVIPIWQRQIESGQPLTVTDARMMRYMMTIPQACQLLIKAAEIGKPGQILIMDMGEPVNILELAKKILKKADKEENIKIIGIRPGETLEEQLMTPGEKLEAVKRDNFYIL